MSDRLVLDDETPQHFAPMLGDVLYAKSAVRVPERDWTALVESVAGGDELALHALYDRAHRVVFTLIFRLTANRETAEELTLDVFYDVWRNAARFDPANGTVIGWIMNQARSRAIDRLRFEGRKKRNGGDVVLPVAVAADPHDRMELRTQSERLCAALATLTPGEREAIETTFFGEMSHSQAAVRLNQPLGTVKTRIRSGLQKLRQALSAETEAR